jgi:predicted polyphosphate/ATP-dependent NAD kinase
VLAQRGLLVEVVPNGRMLRRVAVQQNRYTGGDPPSSTAKDRKAAGRRLRKDSVSAIVVVGGVQE